MSFTAKLSATLAASDETTLDGYEVEQHETEVSGSIKVSTPCAEDCEYSQFDDQDITVDDSGDAIVTDTSGNERGFSFTRRVPLKIEHLT